MNNLRELVVECLQALNPMQMFYTVKKFEHDWAEGERRFPSDLAEEYKDDLYKTRWRRVAGAAVLHYLADVSIALVLLVLAIPVTLGAVAYRSLMLGRLGNIFPFTREERKEYRC